MNRQVVVNVEPDELARLFHEAYERLAPEFGYKTRPESAVPWEDVPEENRWLMAAIIRAVLDTAIEVEFRLIDGKTFAIEEDDVECWVTAPTREDNDQ